MSFSSLSVNPDLLRALPKEVTQPSRIQQLSIPAILNGKDVLALAQTGSGKTYAFGLPMLQRLLHMRSQSPEVSVLSVVIAPTRELAAQIAQSLASLANALTLRVDLLCGGEPIELQAERLTKQVDIIVATPGRLLALAKDNLVNFSHLQTVVLDEADRLLDMGFIADIKALFALMPTRQTLMFSATLPDDLVALADDVLAKSRVRIEANVVNSSVDDIQQLLYHVNKGSKAKALIHLINAHQWPQVLVFVNVKDDADALCKKLIKAGMKAAALHGDKEQAIRQTTLDDFKAGRLNVLIATDVLARGIHIDALPVVINMDLPPQATVYVHRIGRTARAGLSGLALSLVSHAEFETLEAIRVLTRQALPLLTLVDFPVTDVPSNSLSKRAPRDKQANRRTASKRSIRDFSPTQKSK